GRSGFRFHSPHIRTQSIRQLRLEADLRQALERNELRVFYQAKRNLATGAVTGVEALLRWQHVELGTLPPDQFIPLAEETGLIVPVGGGMLEAACTEGGEWCRQGFPPVRIAVNLSARQLADDRLLDDIRLTLEKTGMPAELLELEITESSVVQDIDRAL